MGNDQPLREKIEAFDQRLDTLLELLAKTNNAGNVQSAEAQSQLQTEVRLHLLDAKRSIEAVKLYAGMTAPVPSIPKQEYVRVPTTRPIGPTGGAYTNNKSKSKPQPTISDVRIMVVCTVCQATVRDSRIAQHMAKVHPPKSNRRPESSVQISHQQKSSGAAAKISQHVRCRICKVEVRADRLDRHNIHVHGGLMKQTREGKIRSSTNSSQRSTPKPSQQVNSGSVRSQSLSYIKRQERSNDINFEALEQSYRDRRDGGKEYGESRRENGRFGSLSSYDDHSEDSMP